MTPEKTLEVYISFILQNRLFEQALPSLKSNNWPKELFKIWSNTELLVLTVMYRRIVPEFKKKRKKSLQVPPSCRPPPTCPWFVIALCVVHRQQSPSGLRRSIRHCQLAEWSYQVCWSAWGKLYTCDCVIVLCDCVRQTPWEDSVDPAGPHKASKQPCPHSNTKIYEAVIKAKQFATTSTKAFRNSC